MDSSTAQGRANPPGRRDDDPPGAEGAEGH